MFYSRYRRLNEKSAQWIAADNTEIAVGQRQPCDVSIIGQNRTE